MYLIFSLISFSNTSFRDLTVTNTQVQDLTLPQNSSRDKQTADKYGMLLQQHFDSFNPGVARNHWEAF